MRHHRTILAGTVLAAAMLLGGCSANKAAQGGPAGSSAAISSQYALVVPSLEMRSTLLLSGLPEPGSDFGPFSGRRDERLGASLVGPERVAYGYERRIYDRQYSNVGRPYNTYMDTTRSITRVDR